MACSLHCPALFNCWRIADVSWSGEWTADSGRTRHLRCETFQSFLCEDKLLWLILILHKTDSNILKFSVIKKACTPSFR